MGKTLRGRETKYLRLLKDRYGLSWQLVPASMAKLLSDPEKAKRVMKGVLQMGKLDIARMERTAGAG